MLGALSVSVVRAFLSPASLSFTPHIQRARSTNFQFHTVDPGSENPSNCDGNHLHPEFCRHLPRPVSKTASGLVW